ncbi:MAG: TonB-dependent receptor [Lysobacteraceae bacterium]|nr:MAG: TonB-dependent receptor [Xanthomonadaceae bacterium]
MDTLHMPTSKYLTAAIQYSLLTLVCGPTESVANDSMTPQTGSLTHRVGTHEPALTVIDRAAIERSGHIHLGDLLQELPQAGSDLNLQFNNGGNGETRINLNYLGCAHTLVLFNGQRWIKGRQGCVDVNQISLAIVERIEILDGGWAALFGEGAVAGVVNIVTRTQFEGAQARAQLGKYLEHSDGEAQAFDTSIGVQSERASIYFNANYVQSKAVLAGDRAISREPQYGTGTSFRSSGTPQGRFGFNNPATGTFSDSWTTDPGCNVASRGLSCFRIGDFSFGAPGSGADRFNFAPDNYLLTPQQRTNIYTQARVTLNSNVTLTMDGNYSHGRSTQSLGAAPLFLGLFGFGAASRIGVGALNPYNPTGQALPSSSWLLGRRMVEAPALAFQQNIDSYRFAASLNGQLGDNAPWQWNLDYVYSRVTNHQRNLGLFDLNRIANALSDDCVTGAIAGCVPLNVFGGAGTMTPAMLDYISTSGQDSLDDVLHRYGGHIQGELFELSAGNVSLAAGFSATRQSSQQRLDALGQTYQTTANNPGRHTSGRLHSNEVYVALSVPLLSERPIAKQLELKLAARYLDLASEGQRQNRYALNGRRIDPAMPDSAHQGNATSVALRWQVNEEFQISGGASRDLQYPSLVSLFRETGFDSPTFSDPCNGGAAANPDLPGCAQVPNGYQQVGANHLVTTGSNPYLKPASAKSWIFGLQYEPSWLTGLKLNAGAMDIELSDSPVIIGFQTILNLCATSLQYCQFIERNAYGQIYGNELFNVAVNELRATTRSANFGAMYQHGSLTLDWQGVYLIRSSIQRPGVSNRSVDPITITTGYVGTNQGDFTVPRWKSNLDLTWSNSHWDASWRMRYIHHQREACYAGSYGDFTLPPNAANGGQPYCNLGPDNTGGRDFTQPGGGPDGVLDYRKLGSVTYHDVQLTYHIGDWGTQLTLGVNNLFDKGPPLSQTAFANSFDSSVYETPGRFPYVRVTTDF